MLGIRPVAQLHHQDGFTLVELLLVVIVIALMVTIITPNLVGFLEQGRQESFNGDRRNIQIAVDAYYMDTRVRITVGGVGYSVFPTEYTADGAPGLVTRATNVIISMPLLLDRGYMRLLPSSAAPINGGEIGHYIWIIDSTTGTVYGCPGGSAGAVPHTWTVASYSDDCSYDGQYP